MMAKPMKTLELHYPTIQFLISHFNASELSGSNYHYGANWPSFHGLNIFFVVDLFVCLFVCLCSSSDLSVPITELVRMVKLYSTPWETKSAALKKLHEDYEK